MPGQPYQSEGYVSKRQLDLLEKEINKYKSCFIAQHQQVDTISSGRSSSKKTFTEIIENPKIEAIFSGHTHTKKLKIRHHEGNIEYNSPSAGINGKFGIVSYDNGRLVWTEIDATDDKEIETKNKFIMTHPVPVEQISDHQNFNEKNTEIRVISFLDREIKLHVSGDINGDLVFQRKLTNGANLYSYPLNLENGLHNITVSGDGCEIIRTFYIGEKYKGKREVEIGFIRIMYFINILNIPFFIYYMIIYIPYPEIN